jgi:putative oxidoreductase
MTADVKSLAPMIARYLLGLLFFLSGLAGLLNLAPPPADLPENMITFMKGISVAAYFMPFLKLTETVCGLFLIIRIAPSLMLIILAPISLHIFLVHSFLTPGIKNLILPIVIIVFHVLAATAYWKNYRSLFSRN